MRAYVVILLFFYVFFLTGCASPPKKYCSPVYDSSRVVDGPNPLHCNKVGLTDITTPLLNKYGYWMESRWVYWYDTDKIAFVKKEKGNPVAYDLFDVATLKAAPMTDEIEIEKLKVYIRRTSTNWLDVTDKNKSVGGQVFSAFLAIGNCNYSKSYNMTVGNLDETSSVGVNRYEEYKGKATGNGFLRSCNYRLEKRDCYISISDDIGKDAQVKIPCPPVRDDQFTLLTDDGRYILYHNALIDLTTGKNLIETPLVSQEYSKPPVFLTYVLSPGLDRVAFLYATADKYLIGFSPYTLNL